MRCGCGVRAFGALNLFRAVPGPVPEPDLTLGQTLADVATIGILQERAMHRGELLNEQLQLALNSRLIVEQAKSVQQAKPSWPSTAWGRPPRSTACAITPAATT
jgi:hypothetical protein